MEYAKPFIYSVNGGYSAYILPTGKIASKGNKKGRYMLQVNLKPYIGETLYSKYGYLILLIAMFVWVIAILILTKFSRCNRVAQCE